MLRTALPPTPSPPPATREWFAASLTPRYRTRSADHDFHHQAYVNNLNKAMAGKPEASVASLMATAKVNDPRVQP